MSGPLHRSGEACAGRRVRSCAGFSSSQLSTAFEWAPLPHPSSACISEGFPTRRLAAGSGGVPVRGPAPSGYPLCLAPLPRTRPSPLARLTLLRPPSPAGWPHPSARGGCHMGTPLSWPPSSQTRAWRSTQRASVRGVGGAGERGREGGAGGRLTGGSSIPQRTPSVSHPRSRALRHALHEPAGACCGAALALALGRRARRRARLLVIAPLDRVRRGPASARLPRLYSRGHSNAPSCGRVRV